MIESNSLEHQLKNHHQPLRSINDYSNDDDVEAALRDSIHCTSSFKYRKPQHPSLVDWCSPSSSSEPPARQAVKRELRRLKSLKSFQVLGSEELAPAKAPQEYHSLSCTVHNNSSMCFLPEVNKNQGYMSFSVKSAATAADDPPPTESEPAVDVNTTVSSLNRLVDMATRIFDASTAAISVTDMERQKILACKGIMLQGIQDLPRESALAAHIVSLREDTLVVPDLTTDERFQHLELGDSRFYASAPLVTPEGERIGAVYVLDNKPRPEGLDENQLQLLQHISALAMQSLCERRTRLQLKKKLLSATKVVSATVHDLLTPLTAIELAISLLHEDQDFQGKLSQPQKESVKIASNCVGVLGQMCRRMRDQHSASCKSQANDLNAAGSVPIAAPSSLLQLPSADVGLSADSFRIMYGSEYTSSDQGSLPPTGGSSSALLGSKVLGSPRVMVTVEDLVKSIHMAVDAIPKTIPVTLSLHASVPKSIVTDDLKVLRCALNLLEHCASIASSGSILLSIKPQYCSCGKAMLGFHCENQAEGNSPDGADPASADQCIRDCCSVTCTAASPSSSGLGTSATSSSFMLPTSRRSLDCCHRHGAFERRCLRNCSEINLYSVAMQMDALGGDCGLDGPESNGCDRGNASFWFRIPLVEPQSISDDKETLRMSVTSRLSAKGMASSETNVSIVPDSTSQNLGLEKVPDTLKESKDATLVFEAQPRKRRALIIEDSIVIRKVIANALSKIGFEIETAVNGMEGLHQLQSSTYDVVLCDFLMPVMDGLDCVKQYRDWERMHRPFLHQYIIGMSAHASDQDVDHGLKAGMDCYKPKPLTYKGLKNIVDACEGNQQQNLISKMMESTMGSDCNSQLTSKFDREHPKMCLIAVRDNDAFGLARLTEARRGWKSLIVHDGEDALHALKKRNWDAVLLDEKLPLMSGRKTTEEFRAWEKENRVNCQTNMFILTASTKAEVPCGANGVLQKPVDVREFEQMLVKAEEPSLHIIMR